MPMQARAPFGSADILSTGDAVGPSCNTSQLNGAVELATRYGHFIIILMTSNIQN